jgi:hypothetical protein
MGFHGVSMGFIVKPKLSHGATGLNSSRVGAADVAGAHLDEIQPPISGAELWRDYVLFMFLFVNSHACRRPGGRRERKDGNFSRFARRLRAPITAGMGSDGL